MITSALNRNLLNSLRVFAFASLTLTASAQEAEAVTMTNKQVSHARKKEIVEQFGVKDNFDAEWPKLVKTSSPEITIIEEDKEKKSYIYHSPNYEFISDVQLSKTVLKNFSTLFESTRLYCKELPLSMVKAHIPKETVKFRILLFGTKDDYYKNGGLQGSAGVYKGGTGEILVPLSSLGVKQVGSRYMFDYKSTNKTLPHEIAHQLTNSEYFREGARGWFSEGLAEYIAVTDYRSGKFMVNGNRTDIIKYVTEGSRKDGRGRHLGNEIDMPDLKEFMLMSYSDFTSRGNFNYGVSALLVYYFFHMDGEEREDGEGERENLNKFLIALNEGKKGEEALNELLAGRTFDELEKEISKAWKSKRIKMTFK